MCDISPFILYHVFRYVLRSIAVLPYALLKMHVAPIDTWIHPYTYTEMEDVQNFFSHFVKSWWSSKHGSGKVYEFEHAAWLRVIRGASAPEHTPHVLLA